MLNAATSVEDNSSKNQKTSRILYRFQAVIAKFIGGYWFCCGSAVGAHGHLCPADCPLSVCKTRL